jgi:subtilisin family serine protease
VTIAQIDTGVDLRHPVLSGQWSGPRNFVDQREFPPEMHGTAVAGVTVARADAKTGLVGVSPGARVIPLRGCWEAGPDGAVCSTFTLAKALQHALRESPRVINLSITGPRDRLLETLIDHALDRGIVVVAAGDESGGPGFPASHPRVLAVYGSMPPISSRAMLQAPSQDILTSTPNRTFGFVSGTSFSAAHVSGLTALLLELAPQLTPAQVEALLQSTAASHMNGSKVARIDPCAALSAVAPRSGLACPPAKADRGGRP